MGEKEDNPSQLTFMDFSSSISKDRESPSDGGLILIRELGERLALGKQIGEHLSNARGGANKKIPLADLLRRPVSSHLAGCGATRPACWPGAMVLARRDGVPLPGP